MRDKVCSRCKGTGIIVRILDYPDFLDTRCCDQCEDGGKLARLIASAVSNSA